MKRRATLSPDARLDIEAQAAWFRLSSPAVAVRFLDALRGSLDSLVAMPGKGHPAEAEDPLLHDIRRWPVAGFEGVLVYYRRAPGGIDVVRVIHGARDIPAILGREEE